MMEGLVKVKVTIDINGRKYSADVEPRLLLVDFIRDIAKLKGTHIGCDTSNCGACTVLVNRNSVKSCTMFAFEADGKKVQTVESLAKNGKLSPLQEAFWEHHALQCGYCTPGMLMSSTFLLNRNTNPTDDQIREGIAGNICRCTGYINIIKAVKDAAAKINDEKEEE